MGASQALAENSGPLSCNLDCIHEGPKVRRLTELCPAQLVAVSPNKSNKGLLGRKERGR